MRKIKLAIITTIVISTLVAASGALMLLRSTTASPMPPPPPPPSLFTYTAKWICNTPSSGLPFGINGTVVNTGAAESIGLVPGEYKTDINVHNPGPGNVTILKKFVVSLAETPSMPTPGPNTFAKTFAGPDVAFFITCDEIQRLLGLPSLHAFKGFVILQTTVSNLDVVAEYSSEALDFSPECPYTSFPSLANSNCVEGLTLDVEKISAVSVTTPIPVCSTSSTITTSPSFLNVTRGFNATSTIVITNSPCTTITECFGVTISPAVSGGPTGFVFPSCVTIAPGGSATATLIINAPTTAPPGLYTVTVTATCNACSPVLVQTAIISLRVV